MVFLFNPFGADTMRAFLANLEASLAQAPREAIIVYLNPRHPEVFADSDVWKALPLPLAVRMKFAAASPYRVSVYAN